MNDASLIKAKTQLEALGKVLPARGRVLIIPHDYPDPDAFASAAALHLLLLKRFHIQGQIVFTGMDAYAALLVRANMKVIGRIRHAALPRSYYVQLQDALKSAFIYGRVAWAHLSHVVQPEIVPEVSDLLCRMERVTWSFCTGFREDALVISLRSSQKGVHCGVMLKQIIRTFGGTGGGHDWMAAGVVPVEKLDPVRREELRESLVKLLVSRIEKREVQRESLETVGKSLVQPP